LLKVTIRKAGIVSWLVFIFTITMVVLTTFAAVFPAFYVRNFGGRDDPFGINSFEFGIWGLPIIITNVIIFGSWFFYQRNKLPSYVIKPIKSFFSFEVSPSLAFLIMTVLIGTYVVLSVGELIDGKFQPDYYERVQRWLETFDIYQIGEWGIGAHLQVLLGVMSIQIFDNVETIPFLSSISLIILTYFTAKELSGKRFSGIIASAILLQSGVFLIYDTSIAYPNFWIMFYLLSLLLIYKWWYISPISWVLGTLTKILTVPFLPLTIFFVYRSPISTRRKILCLIFYAIITVLGIIIVTIMEIPVFRSWVFEFDLHDFLGGISSIPYSLRFDGLVLIFLIPLIVALFFRSKNGNLQADSVNFLILGILFLTAIVPSVGLSINVPYRLVPLIVFFAIGVGVVLSSKVVNSTLKVNGK